MRKKRITFVEIPLVVTLPLAAAKKILARENQRRALSTPGLPRAPRSLDDLVESLTYDAIESCFPEATVSLAEGVDA